MRSLRSWTAALLLIGASIHFAPALIAAEASNTVVDGVRDDKLGVKPPTVTVVAADRREMVAEMLVAGTLVPRDEVLIAPEIDGLVTTEILVDEGAHVEKGQVLARLNRASLEVEMLQNKAQLARLDASLLQAKAQIAEAEANKVQADNAYQRAEQLRASGSTSTEIYDQRLNAARSSEARLASATQALAMIAAERRVTQATMDETALKLSRTEIKAPVAGIIARKTIRLGAVAAASGDALFKLIGNGLIELEAEVPEANLLRLRIGQPVRVKPAGAEHSIHGTIRLISPEVDRTTRLGRIRVALPESATAFIGAFARGHIETSREKAVTVPLSAITYGRNGPEVQAVKDGLVETRPVRIGLISEGRAAIEQGLVEGERVVAKAGSFVTDGDRVTPVEAGNKP